MTEMITWSMCACVTTHTYFHFDLGISLFLRILWIWRIFVAATWTYVMEDIVFLLFPSVQTNGYQMLLSAVFSVERFTILASWQGLEGKNLQKTQGRGGSYEMDMFQHNGTTYTQKGPREHVQWRWVTRPTNTHPEGCLRAGGDGWAGGEGEKNGIQLTSWKDYVLMGNSGVSASSHHVSLNTFWQQTLLLFDFAFRIIIIKRVA